MKRCLDEATLQSYFDSELSSDMMESATLHLAACATCAAAARELEQETSLLMAALAPEFETSVPTERLRERIETAVLDLRIGAASSREKAGFLSSLLSFGTQRTLGFASLVMVLAFGAIFGLVKFRSTPQEPVAETQPVKEAQPVKNAGEQVAIAPPEIKPVQVSNPIPLPQKNTNPSYRPVKGTVRTNTAPKAEPVKLFPGERAYLQTIAKLDSTIKANKKDMRPSLQVEYERNLAVVDRAIAATRSAAKRNPKDPDAADFMFSAYQSKVDLLNTIADARLGGGRSH